MATHDYPHPEDEFDVLGADRVPQGVHRTPRPRWRALLPFVLALIIAPALAYLGVTYLASLGSSSSTTSGVTATASPTPGEPVVEPTTVPEETPAAQAAEPEPAQAPVAQAPDVRRETPVFVLNGAGVRGLAAQAAGKLGTDGFAKVSASNYGSSAPSTSTVYYNNAELQDTAEQVASVLGIATLRELPSATNTVAVVLRGDYQR